MTLDAWSAALSFGAAALRRVAGKRLVQGLSLASPLLFLYFAVWIFVHGARELL